MEMTSAYSVFPNQGVRMKPYSIQRVTDRVGKRARGEPAGAEGRDPCRHRFRHDQPAPRRRAARHRAKAGGLNWPVAGKTGTTNDYTDAWFIGFDPDITIGVWIGLDQKKPIGHNMTGTDAALPIWIDIMKAWIGDRKDAPKFEPPGNIVFMSVDKGTGGISEEGTPGAIGEAFIAGTQPGSIKQ